MRGEAMAEKEKWGSGLGKGEANREEERGKTDGTQGWERKVLGWRAGIGGSTSLGSGGI